MKTGKHCTGRVHVHTKKVEGLDFHFADRKIRSLMQMARRQDGMGEIPFDILGRTDFNLQVGMGGEKENLFYIWEESVIW